MAHFTMKYSAAWASPQKAWPLVKRFWPFMRPYKRLALAAAVLMLLSTPITMATPLLVKRVVDQVVPSNDLQQLKDDLAGWIG